MSIDKLPEETRAIHAAIEKELSFDSEGAGNPQDTIYESLLPEEWTLDSVKRLQQFNLNFADGATLALGTKGVPHLKENPELQSVSLRIPMGLDAVASELQRSVERRNPTNGTTFQKPGVVSTKYSTGIASGKGHYKKIQEHISEYASSIFNQ